MDKLAILGGQPAFKEPLHVGRPNLPDRETFNALIDGMFERRWFTNFGPLAKQFQKELESLLKVKHCIPLCNGTIALELACRAIGLKGYDCTLAQYPLRRTLRIIYLPFITYMAYASLYLPTIVLL